MHPLRKQRLLMVLLVLVLAGMAAALAGYALRSNINLFYPPADIAEGKAPTDRRIRAGGMVKEGSVQRDEQSLRTVFEVTDYEADLTVEYARILPDLFAEGEGVVVPGRLSENGLFMAEEVLAKHDENYMPPEVNAALEASKARGAYE